ncbi:MAG: response regulator [Spirochaetaceae bacterium]|nr:MAG: response regulator [Spirochaetaceae bacterium]
MKNNAVILVVDDEKPIRNFLRVSLSSQDYRVIEAVDGRGAISLSASHIPDLIILDLGLPDVDGLEVLRELRQWSSAPVIVLSARDDDRAKIDALDNGADDYLTKPFSVGELLARVRVAFRHVARTVGIGSETETALRIGPLHLDLVKRKVSVGEREIHLTPTEYRLLVHLAQHAGRVLTHGAILKHVWGPSREGETQYLRVFMANLRRKIEDNPAEPRFLLTELGVGYRLADQDEVERFPGERD